MDSSWAQAACCTCLDCCDHSKANDFATWTDHLRARNLRRHAVPGTDHSTMRRRLGAPLSIQSNRPVTFLFPTSLPWLRTGDLIKWAEINLGSVTYARWRSTSAISRRLAPFGAFDCPGRAERVGRHYIWDVQCRHELCSDILMWAGTSMS